MTQIVAMIDKYCQNERRERPGDMYKFNINNNLGLFKSGTDIAKNNNANGTKFNHFQRTKK